MNLLNILVLIRSIRIILLSTALTIPFYLFGQPGNGGGQGNPCAGPNPPPSCPSMVPIQVDALILAGIVFGTWYLIKTQQKEA